MTWRRPRTGRQPYAVVQLRQDDLAGDHYSLVGFQTQLKWGEQARLLRLIPGLERAEFVRFGMVHRNTYINAPTVLADTWQVRNRPSLFFAGQISGVEGYIESAASGLIAGINAALMMRGQAVSAPPRTTAIGALGITKGNNLQVYAPITNENIYTNLWQGPYYGFERVLETFEMTDKPRRIYVDTTNPRELAAALIAGPDVLGVQVDDGTVHVETSDPAGLARRLPTLSIDHSIPISKVEPVDESLESVFRYLVEGR